MTRFRLAVAALCVTALAVTAVGTASQTKTTKTTKNEAVSGNLSIIGIWTGPEQKRFQAVLDGFEKLYPNVKRQVHVGRRQHADDPLHRDPGRQPARSRVDRSAGPSPGLRQPGSAQADRVRTRDRRAELHRRLAQARHRQGQALRPLLQGGEQVDGLVLDGGVQRPPASGLRRRGPRCCAAANTMRASGTPAFSIGGADGWTLTDLFENIYIRQAGPARYDQLTSTRSRGRIRR